jgi:cellulose synthase/poly-beta-1,6-N-acetylglucosamine synthase-like glycosyltransferase
MTALIFTLSIVLWGALALLAHTYAVYPVMMRLLARGRALPEDRFEREEELPEVAVLMAVYNEEKVLEETIASILASDYPRGKLRLFIGSDGSTDRSEAIVKQFAKTDPRVRLVGFGGRNGKIRIVNRLAEGATSEFADPDKALFLLCDANVTWSPPMLRRLASHFKRDRVGLVGAAVCDRVREHAGIGDQEEAYIGQENVVKYAEGVLWGSVMGAFGACYALRARLFTPVPPHHIVDDFYLTLACLEQGGDAIVDLEAVCHEAVSTDIREEFRRKRRIAAGNFQNLARFWSYLLPWNSDPATTFAFWSHKGLRWCGPHLLVAAFVSCLALAAIHPIHLLPLAGFATVLVMAGLDRLLAGKTGRSVKLFRFARYFLSMNLAIGAGFLDYLRGPRTSVWEPTRRETPQAPGPTARNEPRPEPLVRR